MSTFLFLAWHATDRDAAAVAETVRAELRAAPDWRIHLDIPGHFVAATDQTRFILNKTSKRTAILVGDLFNRDGTPCHVLPAAQSFQTMCVKLLRYQWGSYVLADVGERLPLTVLRDPLGQCDTVSWFHGGVRFVTSVPLKWIRLFPPVSLALDWKTIASLLVQPAGCFEQAPFSGLVTMTPGAITTFEGTTHHERRLWCPRQFYSSTNANAASLDTLFATAQGAVSAWQKRHPRAVLEISGGFDSAVVAGLGAATPNRPRLGVNFHTNDRAGDERHYARAVSSLISIPLDEILVPVRAIDHADLAAMPAGIRPGLGSISLFHDRRLSRIIEQTRFDTILTGHGGDSVFFQHPTPLIAADPSFKLKNLQQLELLATWTGESMWRIVGHFLNFPGIFVRPVRNTVMTALPLTFRSVPNPLQWAGDTIGLPPAKRLHIEAIASDRAAFGPSSRSAATTVIHPLLSQPLVELVLGLDVALLTEGRRDRAMARRAFASILPRMLVERRGKGSLTQFYGRMLARSALFLRESFLDGVLVREGLLDAQRLEAILSRDFLMQHDCYGELLTALVLEYWLKHWYDYLAAMPRTKRLVPTTPTMFRAAI